ncbi:MAG: ABC transporter permease [Gemmataceae bacterium]
MISLRSLPVRSGRYHWRANLPVALGVAVGAAVLTGALLVGDSLRGSLRDRAVRQLNGVTGAYVGPRFVRQELGNEEAGVVPATLLTGSARTAGPSGGERFVTKVQVIAVPDLGLGWPTGNMMAGRMEITPDPTRASAVLSYRLAERLGVKIGDAIELGVERQSAVPKSSLLGKRGLEDLTSTVRVMVESVLPADHPANDFSLAPNPDAPLNVFVPLAFLQQRLERTGRVNALLAVSEPEPLAGRLTLDDWGLRVRAGEKRSAYVSVESERLMLAPAEVSAVEKAAAAINATSRRTFSYMANAISAGSEMLPNSDPGTGKKLIPYSVVAALDPAAPPPLGPFLPPGADRIADDEIVLLDWPESPLKGLKPGDPVTLTYFKPETDAQIEETSATFRLKGYVPLTGPADDPDLTPPFPGITDKLTIRDWNSPFPLNRSRIRSGDANERFWNRHKTAPKGYITQSKGEQLWGSRFGDVTSVRVAPAPGLTAAQTAERLQSELLKTLDPDAVGLRFEPVRERLLEASKGGTDFAGLFLAFSWLLILTALLLVGLMFRLAVERRAKEVGLLLAAGYSPGLVTRLLLVEGGVVAAVGSLLGVLAAIGYARLMLGVLVALWPDAEVGRFLTLHVTPVSLAGGFVASVLVAVLTVWLSVRGLVKVAPPALLRGETRTAEEAAAPAKTPWLSLGIAVVSAVVGAGLLSAGGTRSNPDERSMAFFGGGGLLLVAGLLLARFLLKRDRHATIRSRGTAGVAVLGVRNAARNPSRTLLTAALIALAAFLIVSVESFRRSPDADFLTKSGGSGGFRLLAEADVPLFEPFDKGNGKGELLDRLQAAWQVPSTDPKLAEAGKTLDAVQAVSLRLQTGDDASCLNLYQAGRPRVLGVPDALIERGGFRFGDTVAVTPEEKANPWLLFRKPQPDGAVPVIAEQNTAMFMLKVMVNGKLTLRDESGAEVPARLVGVLQDSPFQSEVIVSDAAFRRLYPRTEGFRLFLLDAPAGTENQVATLLETGLRANGLSVTRTADKVAAYQRVVGAYLSTFQLLGAFALLLAVLGLGVAILRAVWERAAELALLRAVGYPTGALQTLVGAETLIVLAVGLGVGVLAAVASVLPNLALGGSVPWAKLAGLLAVVAVVGLLVARLATAGVARAAVVPALRRE